MSRGAVIRIFLNQKTSSIDLEQDGLLARYFSNRSWQLVSGSPDCGFEDLKAEEKYRGRSAMQDVTGDPEPLDIDQAISRLEADGAFTEGMDLRDCDLRIQEELSRLLQQTYAAPSHLYSHICKRQSDCLCKEHRAFSRYCWRD